MYKSHYVKGPSAEKYLYKIYANKLTKLKNLAKNYFHQQFLVHRNQPKKT